MPTYPMTEDSIALPPGGVRTLIRELGGEEDPTAAPYPYTGALRLMKPNGKRATLWTHEGTMYAAHLDDYVPPIALRLRSARLLNDQQYTEIKDLPSEDAGPEVVERNWVPIHIVEELHREIMLATLSHLYDWNDAIWWWEENAITDQYVTSGLPLMLAASAVDERIAQWKAVTRAYPDVVRPKATPYPAAAWHNRNLTIMTPEAETALAYIDGHNDIAQIAANCGLTRFEIAKILSQTLAVGIITFAPDKAISVPAAQTPSPSPQPAAPITPLAPPSPSPLAPQARMGIIAPGATHTTPDSDLTSAPRLSSPAPPPLHARPRLAAETREQQHTEEIGLASPMAGQDEDVSTEDGVEPEDNIVTEALEDEAVTYANDILTEAGEPEAKRPDADDSDAGEPSEEHDSQSDEDQEDVHHGGGELGDAETAIALAALQAEMRDTVHQLDAVLTRLNEISDQIDRLSG